MTTIQRRSQKEGSKQDAPKSSKKVSKKKSPMGHGTESGQVAGHVKSVRGKVGEVNEPMVRNEAKTARYEIRFTAQQLEIMEKASSILGYKNATDYIRHVMQENATKIIKDQVILQIAENDRQRFMDELTSPSAPTEAFKKGAELFNKTFKD